MFRTCVISTKQLKDAKFPMLNNLATDIVNNKFIPWLKSQYKRAYIRELRDQKDLVNAVTDTLARCLKENNIEVDYILSGDSLKIIEEFVGELIDKKKEEEKLAEEAKLLANKNRVEDYFSQTNSKNAYQFINKHFNNYIDDFLKQFVVDE
jgi:glutamyl-tRNA reductase